MSAIDFCVRVVEPRQRELHGAVSVLDYDQQSRLDKLVKQFVQSGFSAQLDRQALMFLLEYRAAEARRPVLEDEEREQLNAILTPSTPTTNTPVRHEPKLRITWSQLSRRARFAIAGAGMGLLLVVVGYNATTSDQSSGPPTISVQEHPPAVEVPPGSTDLQDFKRNYGPFEQLTPSEQRPQTGNPALLLLEDGGYFVSTQWTVTLDADGWHKDIAGNVNNVAVRGTYASITTANGSLYIVGIDQPFLVSGNPGTVLLIDATGNVKSMSLAQATAVRQPLD